jgi:hypothetical protein
MINKNVTKLTTQGCNNTAMSWLYRTCWNNLVTSLIIPARLLQIVNRLFQTCWQLVTTVRTQLVDETCYKMWDFCVTDTEIIGDTQKSRILYQVCQQAINKLCSHCLSQVVNKLLVPSCQQVWNMLPVTTCAFLHVYVAACYFCCWYVYYGNTSLVLCETFCKSSQRQCGLCGLETIYTKGTSNTFLLLENGSKVHVCYIV